jgi:hypothetical protein
MYEIQRQKISDLASSESNAGIAHSIWRELRGVATEHAGKHTQGNTCWDSHAGKKTLGKCVGVLQNTRTADGAAPGALPQ